MAYTFKHGDRPLDGYTIQRAVGKGGFGEVYYAISDGGREVALKYLRDNPQIELRGVSHCINLKSPHLVSIFDVKKTYDGEYVIIMEYCSGPSLRDLLIAEPKGFGPQKAAFFVREIAKGLGYLHDRGIVHRDLKPGNIFYDDGYVKIGDYGLSKFISVSRHSAQTASVGTVHYMAPEIGSGNYSRGVDIYALGVMLYEMLLGTVPFEGSSMAEILMKHLTAQPELDKLPHPFGDVIRKALEKDPKDRYQTADELIDDLLGVEEIKQSLAGFSTQSLDGAIRQHTPGAMDSPVPSPNPMPRLDAGQPPFAQPVGPLPPPLNRRMKRVSRKFDRKMARLAKRQGRTPTPPSLPQEMPPLPQQGGASASRAPGDIYRSRRALLGLIIGVGLSAGLGIICGNAMDSDEVGVSAAMLVVAMAFGIGFSRKVIPWFGADHGPNWMRRIIQLGCCAPLLAMGAAPILDTHTDPALGVCLALLVMCVFANWDKELDCATAGEMSFWTAIWTAFSALFFAAIATEIIAGDKAEGFMFMTAGVAGLVSLILQASSWWVHEPTTSPSGPPVGFPGALDRMHRAASSPMDIEGEGYGDDGSSVAEAQKLEDTLQPAQRVAARWMFTRAFWSIAAFVLMGGAIVTFLMALIAEQLSYHDLTATLIGCIACAAFMIFALCKTTATKRDGFWRETLRPFLLSATLFGIGATILGIAREWGHRSEWGRCLPDEGRVMLLCGLILCSLLYLGLLVSFLWRPKRPHDSFLLEASTDQGAMQTEPRDRISSESPPI